jgi:hypothetical protein
VLSSLLTVYGSQEPAVPVYLYRDKRRDKLHPSRHIILHFGLLTGSAIFFSRFIFNSLTLGAVSS